MIVKVQSRGCLLKRTVSLLLSSQAKMSGGKWKGYEKLLVENGCIVRADKIPMQSELDRALEESTDLNKKIAQLLSLTNLLMKTCSC